MKSISGTISLSFPAEAAAPSAAAGPPASDQAMNSAPTPPARYTESWSTSVHTTALKPPNQV